MKVVGICMVIIGSFGFGYFCRDLWSELKKLNWNWLVMDDPYDFKKTASQINALYALDQKSPLLDLRDSRHRSASLNLRRAKRNGNEGGG